LPGYKELMEKQAAAADNILKNIKQRREKSGVPVITPECEADLGVFNQALAAGVPWAMSMRHSWGSANSLLYEGDNFWEGSYDTCAENEEYGRRAGDAGLPTKFCEVEWWSGIFAVAGLPPSRDGIGMCLPQSCAEYDFGEYVFEGVVNGTLGVPLGYPLFNPESVEVFCVETKIANEWRMMNDGNAIACFCVLGLFVLLAVVGTIYDLYGVSQQEKFEEHQKLMEKSGVVNNGFSDSEGTLNGHAGVSRGFTGNEAKKWQPSTFGKILMSFSISRNARGIMNYKQPRGSIECLNGIRFLTFAWILLGHTYQLGNTVGSNRSNMGAKFRLGQMLGTVDHQTIHQMNLAVETFFVLSAMLTTISFMKKLARQIPDCQMMGLYYFHRYWRLTPVYMLVVMFYACMAPYLWRGPFYAENGDAIACRKGWWQNLIYLNNLLRTDSGMCVGWTWYLANDFQFYVFAPAILFPLFYLAPLGITLGVLCGVGGVIARVVIHHFQFVDGVEIDGFWMIYCKPWTRCTTYFVGMLFGYMMYKIKFKARLHPSLTVLGWILGLAAVSCSVFLVATRDGWNAQGNVAWESLQRLLFTFGVCWIIFACSTGNGGFINNILSWDGWVPCARLSYVAFLIHPILLYWYAGLSPLQYYPTHWELIMRFLGMTLFTMGISFAVSLLFEVPFSALEKVMFANIPKPKPNKPKQEVTPMVVNGNHRSNDNGINKSYPTQSYTTTTELPNNTFTEKPKEEQSVYL